MAGSEMGIKVSSSRINLVLPKGLSFLQIVSVVTSFFATILALTSLHSIQSERYLSISMITIEPLQSTSLARTPLLRSKTLSNCQDVVTDKLGVFLSMHSSVPVVGAYSN
jgi:hypothetical protein